MTPSTDASRRRGSTSSQGGNLPVVNSETSTSLLNGSSIVLGPLSLAQLAGRALRDEGTLTLSKAPAHVARHTTGATTRHAIVLGEAIGRRGLMDMLYAVAPYKAHGPDRFPRVIDNWQLHDRAKASPNSDGLLKQHEASLRQHWHEFSRHRELYLSLFQDSHDSQFVVPVIAWEVAADGVRRAIFEPLADGIASLIAQSAPVAEGATSSASDTLLGLVSIAYFLPGLSRTWRAWQPLVKNGKSNYIGPASVPMMALMHRRALLNSGMIRNAEALLADNASPTSA